MGVNVFELCASITLDSKDYEKGVDGVKKSSDQAKAQMQSLQSIADAMGNRVKVLSARFDEEKTKLSELSAKLNESIAVNGETSEETQKLAEQFAKAQAKVKSLGAQLTTVAAESARADEQLEALKNGTAGVEDGMEVAGESTDKFSDKLKQAESGISGFAEKLQSGLATAAKIGGAALTAASAAIGFLTKEAVEQYSEYEQLAGGAELMFGDAYKTVANNAKNAYQEVQMSQNDYLQQVNGFATGLKTALGGNEQAAAELAHKIIVAEADVVAATGNSQEAVQNAFNGIMKSNYTMLDNLQLGITPTKEGFQQLIDSVNEWNTANGNATNYTIDNMADAQSALVDYIEMQGLAGYASNEAAGTIQGSVASMKAAWANLATGMADGNADISGLVGSFADSVLTAGENIIPRVMQVLEGVGDAIVEMSPVISETVPELVESLLPELISAGGTLLSAVANGVLSAIPGLYNALMGGVETILTDVFGVSEESATAFSDGVTNALGAIGDGFSATVTSAQTEGTFLNEVWTGLQETGQALGEFCSELFEMISTAFQWCVEQINTEGTFLNTYVGNTWENIKTVVTTAINTVEEIINIFTSVLQGDWSGAWESVESIASGTWSAISSIISNVVETVSSFLATMVETGTELIAKLEEGISNKFAELYSVASGWVQDNIITPITNMGQSLYDAGKGLIDRMWQGLKDAWEGVKKWWDGLTFSDKNANATITTNGSHKNGLDYVPFDGYMAELHRGESVLTAEEASLWRSGKSQNTGNSGLYITQNINVPVENPAEIAAATEAYFQQARWAIAW